MEIQYIGHSCFRIKGKKVIVVTDPFQPSVGLKMPKLTADIITVSHNHYDHNDAQAVAGGNRRQKPFLIDGPGEYEVAGVSVFGIASFHDEVQGKKRGKNTIFLINFDGLRLVHLGDLGHKLDERQLQEVDGADILFVPVGGTFTLSARSASEVVSQIEPSVVIPMHYRLSGLKIDLAPVDDFLKEMGVESPKPLPKLVISRDKLPEERQVVVLKARGHG